MLRQTMQIEPQNQTQSSLAPAATTTRPFLVEKKTTGTTNLLPPAPSSSWSLPKQVNNSQLFFSPAVSTNGFYVKHSSNEHGVAESPALLPGKAKTAVGALLAKQHNANNNLNYPPLLAAASSASTGGYEGDADGPPLLPVDTNEEWGYNNGYQECALDEEDNPNSTIYEDEKPYYALEKDPIQQSRTPPRNTKIKNYLSPVTMNSSFVEASPSSLAKRAQDNSLHVASASSLMGQNFLESSRNWPSTAHDGDDYDDNNNEADSSRVGLMRSYQYSGEGLERAKYDFTPLNDASILTNTHVTEVVLASDQTHISAMSLSVPDANQANQGDVLSNKDSGCDDETDDSLVSQKVKNQRRSREDLVAAVVERLQDDIDLVTQVEDLGRPVTQEMGDWFVNTDLNREGILTGISLPNRRILSRNLAAILEELRGVARPEDFIALSPSEVPQYHETHSDLYQALNFCNSLVLMAIPLSEQQTSSILQHAKFQGRWKMDQSIRDSMKPASGVNTPEIAKRGGGDTSVFTLPSESADTPMTSNLSISTIQRDWSNKQRFHVESGHIRQTIEMVSTLLEKLSCTFRLWLESPPTSELVKITRNLKRYYLQLVAIRHDDLVSLVHAFELEQGNVTSLPPIAQLVSADEGDLPLNEEDEEEENHAAVLPASSKTGDSSSPVQSLDMDSSKGCHCVGEWDDLRRQMGSNDYSESEELREGPQE